jgi:hypothetical protein
LRLPQDCKYDVSAGVVHLPKLGPVRLRHSREALGTLKNVTLRQERGRWVASLQTEREVEVGAPAACAAVGLDAVRHGPSSSSPSSSKPDRCDAARRREQRAPPHHHPNGSASPLGSSRCQPAMDGALRRDSVDHALVQHLLGQLHTNAVELALHTRAPSIWKCSTRTFV